MNIIYIQYEQKGLTVDTSSPGYSSTVTTYGDNIEVHKSHNWNRNICSVGDGKTQVTLLNMKDKFNDYMFNLGDIAPSLLVGKKIGIYKVDNDNFKFSKAVVGCVDNTIKVQTTTLSDYNNGLKRINVEVELQLIAVIKIS